ncbi:MAG: nitroreductase family protein [Promethearchaeota archaeon]
MDVYEAIRKRKSVRRYKDKEVEQEKLTRILEAARLAPSASNKQEWRFVVVKDKEKRRKLSEAARGQKFVAEAPVVIACCAETDYHEMTCSQLCYPIDVAIAIDHITLAAVEEDLGTCWIGAFYEDKAKEILDIPDRIRVVELLTLGYPVDDSIKDKDKLRLPIETIVKWEKWE